MNTLDLMKKWGDVYKQKESDYGSSWEKTGKILSILFDKEQINLDSVQKQNAFALLIRIIDKICRFSNLYFKNKDICVNDEKLVDTLCDGGTYLFMLGSLLDKKDDISER